MFADYGEVLGIISLFMGCYYVYFRGWSQYEDIVSS